MAKIKIGIVSSINHSRKTVRVRLPLQNDMISAELYVLKQVEPWMPGLDNQVLCLFTTQNSGFVVGVIQDGDA